MIGIVSILGLVALATGIGFILWEENRDYKIAEKKVAEEAEWKAIIERAKSDNRL